LVNNTGKLSSVDLGFHKAEQKMHIKRS